MQKEPFFIKCMKYLPLCIFILSLLSVFIITATWTNGELDEGGSIRWPILIGGTVLAINLQIGYYLAKAAWLYITKNGE